ncbi:MAG: hypothetical protein ACLPSW_31340, partial [Roseiarcus sp.]
MATTHRLQAEPMFVAREDLDWPVGAVRRFFGDGGFEVFSNAAASSGGADFGFFGRGVWIDMPQVFRAS